MGVCFGISRLRTAIRRVLFNFSQQMYFNRRVYIK
nr:MAG TPA: hypothetical protein [Caudoviricetes sp.]